MKFSDYVLLEVIKTGLACLTLGFGWFIGQQIIAYWDIRKKRQELDIAAATQFHKLYGEFKEVSRLYRSVVFRGVRNSNIAFPDSVPLELLRRASAAEGAIEAIIVKLVTERLLEAKEIRFLGLFRQAYQKLREAIRDGKEFEYVYGTPEYALYNELACECTSIIMRSEETRFGVFNRDKGKTPAQVLATITAIRTEDWEAEVGRRRPCTQGAASS